MELELKKTREDVSIIDNKIRDIFKSELLTHKVPDRVPSGWCKEKLKIVIPIDMIDHVQLSKVFNKVESLLIERTNLRNSEASMMLSLGMIDKLETVPD